MPEPIITPVRSHSSSPSGCQPESSTACTAAAIAKMMNSSIRRWSLGGTQSSALNRPDARSPRGTWPAIRDGRSETSKDWIAPIPDSPASRRRHTCSRPIPSGVTSPMPVTTTRLMLAMLPRLSGGCARGGPSPGRLGAVRRLSTLSYAPR